MIIHARSRRLLEQVDAVLHGGALEDSRLDLTLAPVSLVPFVHHIVHLNTAMATAKDITLDMTTEGAEPRALIDAERLEQVLDTVIGDALDRTRAGGHVSVRVERTAQEAIVTVHDDGAAPLPRGLKVAIVELIVNGHGGRVEGRGATRGWRWQLTLPLLQGGGNDG